MEERYQELLKDERFIHAVADLLLSELLPQKSLTIKQKYNWEQRWKKIVSSAEREYAAKLTSYFEAQQAALLSKIPETPTKDYFSNTGWKFDIEEWQDMLEEFGGEFVKDMYEQIGDEVFDYLRYVTGNPQIVTSFDVQDANVQDFIDNYSYQFAKGVMETTIDDLKNAISTGMDEGLSMREIGKLIEESSTFSAQRAELIARTETIRASNYAQIESYKQSGVVLKKEWLVTEDDRLCVWCASMQGIQIDLDETYFDKDEDYTVGTGDDAQTTTFDYEAIDGPPLHPNCRCTLVPVVDESYLEEEQPEEKRGLALVFKGEAEGHPFRGNQYTEGESDGVPDDAAIMAADRFLNEGRRIVADFAMGPKGQSKEIAAAATPTGMHQVEGDIDGVTIPMALQKNIITMIHNHPSASSFSDQDVYTLMCWKNMQSMEVAAPGGFIYRLQKTNKNEYGVPIAQAMYDDWNEIRERIHDKYQRRYDNGEPAFQLNVEHTDEVMRLLAEKYADVIQYTKSQVKPSWQKTVASFIQLPKKTDDVWRIDDRKINGNPYEKPAVKGEGPGHPFRGNQYTEGEEGAESAPAMGSREPRTQTDTELRDYVKMTADFMNRNPRAEGQAFSGPHDIVMKLGRFFEPADRPSWLKKGKDKLCFMNAAQLADRHRDLTYVEGFAVPSGIGIPMHHAWCVDKDGKVLDNTWAKKGQAYFGVAFDTRYLWDALAKTRHYGMFTDFPNDKYDPYQNGFPKEALKSVKGGAGSGEEVGHPFRGNQWITPGGEGVPKEGQRVRVDREADTWMKKYGVDQSEIVSALASVPAEKMYVQLERWGLKGNTGMHIDVRWHTPGMTSAAEMRVELLQNGGYWHIFELPDEFQAHHSAQKIMAAVEDIARKAGVPHIKLNADISVGMYAWARLGFDFENSGYINIVRQTLQDYIVEKAEKFGIKLNGKELRSKLMKLQTAGDVAAFTLPGFDFTDDHWETGNSSVPEDMRMHIGKAFMLDKTGMGLGGWDGIKRIKKEK